MLSVVECLLYIVYLEKTKETAVKKSAALKETNKNVSKVFKRLHKTDKSIRIYSCHKNNCRN